MTTIDVDLVQSKKRVTWLEMEKVAAEKIASYSDEQIDLI